MYIAIAGNIGSGKTSLTDILTEKFNARPFYEDMNNPYIADFYEDMHRWAFNFQIYFLSSRICQAMELQKMEGCVVQDRTIYEDAHIFADNLHQMGLMSSRDFGTYMKIFDFATKLVPQPDLLIYLRASVPTLVNQILKRGRSYEMGIDIDYLERLNNKYNNWIDNIYPGEVLTINMDDKDFISDPEIIDSIVEKAARIKERKDSRKP